MERKGKRDILTKYTSVSLLETLKIVSERMGKALLGEIIIRMLFCMETDRPITNRLINIRCGAMRCDAIRLDDCLSDANSNLKLQ